MPIHEEVAWLYTRGQDSIRLVRSDQPHGACRLFVFGPGRILERQTFSDMTECSRLQAEIESDLMAEGYQLSQSSAERRKGVAMWQGTDRRAGQSSPTSLPDAGDGDAESRSPIAQKSLPHRGGS